MSTNCTILGVSCSPVKVTLAPWTLRLLGQVEGQKTLDKPIGTEPFTCETYIRMF